MPDDTKGTEENPIPSPYGSSRDTTGTGMGNRAEDQAQQDYNEEANTTGKDPLPDKTPDWADIPEAGKKK